jgi:hypothetical protein
MSNATGLSCTTVSGKEMVTVLRAAVACSVHASMSMGWGAAACGLGGISPIAIVVAIQMESKREAWLRGWKPRSRTAEATMKVSIRLLL